MVSPLRPASLPATNLLREPRLVALIRHCLDRFIQCDTRTGAFLKCGIDDGVIICTITWLFMSVGAFDHVTRDRVQYIRGVQSPTRRPNGPVASAQSTYSKQKD